MIQHPVFLFNWVTGDVTLARGLTGLRWLSDGPAGDTDIELTGKVREF